MQIELSSLRDMADKVAYGAEHSALLRAAKLAQV